MAERRVDPGSYALRFADGERSVPVADPMTTLVADFVACCRDGDTGAGRRGERIVERARLLETIREAWPTAAGA